MARERREHEDYLEDNEPVGVVILNDIIYLLEDISEIIMDVAKLQRKRPEEFQTIFASEPGLQMLNDLLPEEIMDKVKAAVFDLIGVASSVKDEIEPTAESSLSIGPVSMDPEKLTPDKLETLGKALQQQTEKISKSIADFEAGLLKDKK